MQNLAQPWDTPAYYQPVRIRPIRDYHVLSISLALAVIVSGMTGALVYDRMTQLSDIDAYVAMGPSQSHIEADHASSEPTLLVTLTPPAYPAMLNTAYNDVPTIRLSARVPAADAAIISEATIGEMPAAQEAAADTAAPIDAAPDDGESSLEDEVPAESSADSSM